MSDFWDGEVSYDGAGVSRREAAGRRLAAGIPLAETVAELMAGTAAFADGRWLPHVCSRGPNKDKDCLKNPATGELKYEDAAGRPVRHDVATRAGLLGGGRSKRPKAAGGLVRGIPLSFVSQGGSGVAAADVVPNASIRLYGETDRFDNREYRLSVRSPMFLGANDPPDVETPRIAAWIGTLSRDAVGELAGMLYRRNRLWSHDVVPPELDGVVADWVEEYGGDRKWTDRTFAEAKLAPEAVHGTYAVYPVSFDKTFAVGDAAAMPTRRSGGRNRRRDDPVRGRLVAVGTHEVTVEGRDASGRTQRRRLDLEAFYRSNRTEIEDAAAPIRPGVIAGLVRHENGHDVFALADGRFAYAWGRPQADQGLLPAHLRREKPAVGSTIETPRQGWRVYGSVEAATAAMQDAVASSVRRDVVADEQKERMRHLPEIS